MRKQLLFQLAIIFLSLESSIAQNWIDTWQRENNFYTIQAEFNAYCREKENDKMEQGETDGDEEGLFSGYIQFKRWEAFMEPRVYPSGDISLATTALKNYQDFLEQNINAENEKSISGPWTAMGPMGNLTGLATNGLPRKAGRINFITFHPSDANTYWVGSPAGGLWKTTDNGSTWATTTDNLAVIGCTDLAIDPTNSSIMYLATGDGYMSQRNPSSVGVLKSTDGGATWNATGLVFPLSQKTEVRHILINPLNPQIVMASTSTGVYRTTTGGSGAWTQVLSTNTYDIAFKPTNPDTVYAAGLRFRRSTDGGVNWTQISAGVPTGGAQRMEIATTVANPNLVYVLSANSSTYGLQGVYRSTDAGTNFTQMATTPDIVASDCYITTTSGQGWYDLAFAASPLNQNELVAGGLGAWRSTDGGSSWTNIGCAYNWNSNVPFVHTDHQEMEYTTAGVLYDVNDGGLCRYTGTAWTDLTNPMNIAQIYKIGLSSLSSNLWITGHQDNGSNIYNNGVYKASLAADGTSNFIDRTNDQKMFASIWGGQFYKSNDGGASWNACVTGLTGSSAFVTPWKQDPQVATTLYAGKVQMFRSVNSGDSWTATPGTMPGVNSSQYITEFAIAPSNNQYIYAIHGTTGMFVSTDAGSSWTLSNTGISTGSGALTFVSVDPSNPLKAYVTQSGYTAGKKVYKTIDGGANWTNISYNLPNLPANCSVFETGNANGGIYVGMDVGVYYIDDVVLGGGNPLWTLYNTGLPNTPVMDMAISPAAPGKIRAATFGRGVYQADIGTVTGIIPALNGEIKYTVYPNPATDVLTLKIKVDYAADFAIEISNASGNSVLKQNLKFNTDKTEQQLNIASLAAGAYFLRIISKEGNSQLVKIIKQ